MYKRNPIVFGLFILIVTGIFIYNFTLPGSKISKNRQADRNGIKSAIINNSEKLLSLSNLIKSQLDTPFYAEYRVKQNKFLFNYINGDNISNPFILNDSIESEIFQNAKNFSILKIWRYEKENFHRLELRNNDERPQILVLFDDDVLHFKEGSQIAKVKITSNDKEVIDISADVILKVSDKIFIYFKKPGSLSIQ